LQTHIVQNTEIKMRDNVFDSRATVQGLTYTQNQPLGSEETRYRGRGSDGHGTRVIRRTDLRTHNGGQKYPHYQQQRPPRFSNLQEKDLSSQEKLEKKVNDEVSKNVSGQMMEGREEDSNDEDGGEWMEVKGRRAVKDETKKYSTSSSSHSHPRSSPTFNQGRKKTPEPQQNYFPKRRSPDLQSQRRGSPDLNNYSRRKSKSPPTTSNNGKVNSHRGHRRYERRGSNSSQEGSEDMTSKTGNKPVPASSSNNVQLNHEDLMKRIPHMMMVSDLPDERIARSKKFTRTLSEREMFLKLNEEKLMLQEDILQFLQISWKEISSELKDSKIIYYNCM